MSRTTASARVNVLETRRIGVVGASGQVGYFLLPRLLAAGATVAALGRGPRPVHIAAHPRLLWHQGALEEDWPDVLPIEYLLSAGPLDTLARSLERHWHPHLREVIALSSTSIDSKEMSPDPAERALAAQLVAAEGRLRDACARHSATLVRIRPTLIYGCGLDRSLSPMLARVRRLGVLPLPWPAPGLRQPVHADDLAALMMTCIDRDDLDGRCFEAGGGERLPFATMLRRAAGAVGRHLVLPVPVSVLRMLLPHMRGALSRLSLDLVAHDEEVRQLLGWQARCFQPGAGDFENRTEPYVFRDAA
jgi:nucleoside-diphosphate-sugar epimerase